MTTLLTRPPPAPARPSTPLLGEAARFLLVGGVATLVDVGVFNALHYGVGIGPLTSKVGSTVLAAVVAFVGNRQWSFDGARGTRLRTQVWLYVLVTVGALALSLLPLAVARYVLGLTGAVALNVAGNVIGLALGTAARFWGYRRWVFAPETTPAMVPVLEREPERLAA